MHFQLFKTSTLFLLICLVSFSIKGQTIVKSKEDKVSNKSSSLVNDKFKDRLWYGGNISIGLENNGLESYFGIGISPLVGYKITPNFSVGPRIEFAYSAQKRLNLPSTKIIKFNAFTYGGGIFSRYKFFNVVFAHAEAMILSEPYLNYGEVDNKVRPGLLLGLGYNGGGGEVYLLYDFLRDTENSSNFPLDLRFGFTYKF